MVKVAIVILNYNGEHHLKEFLPSVLEHSTPHEIHVVDNASTDHSVDIIKSEFPQVQLHQLDSNLGFSAGYNRALTNITSEFRII